MYHVVYINSRGKEMHKYFETCSAALDFTRILDKRITRGSCGGYILTSK